MLYEHTFSICLFLMKVKKELEQSIQNGKEFTNEIKFQPELTWNEIRNNIRILDRQLGDCNKHAIRKGRVLLRVK